MQEEFEKGRIMQKWDGSRLQSRKDFFIGSNAKRFFCFFRLCACEQRQA
jgi:hypothetical protein